MKRAIIRNNLLLLLGAFFIFFIVVFFSLYTFEKRNQETFMGFLLNEVNIAYEQYTGTDSEFVDDYGYEDRRITIMDEHAVVLADSHHSEIGYDESDQYEILNLGRVASRESAHIGEQLLYIAMQLDDGAILRVSIPLATQTRLYSIIIWTLTFGTVVIGVIYYYGLKQVNKNLLKPWNSVKEGLLALNQGKYQLMSLTSPYPEINDILHEMNTINEETSKHLYQIEAYHHQLDRILNSLQQAVLLFNGDEKLTYFNADAKELFKLDDDDLIAPSYWFIRDNDLKQAIHETNVSGDDLIMDVLYDEIIYEVKTIHLETIEEFGDQPRILVILKDVTQQRQLEQVKRDFIAHASHELKSPLTVIKGNAELIELDMLKSKEDIKNSAIQINKQTIQMTALIEDMLMLSRLENLTDKPHDAYDLSVILSDVVDQLSIEAKQKDMTLNVDASKVTMICDPLDIHKLFKNLIENAIKYSENKKAIHIKLKKEQKFITFIVKDHGIGIPKEHQQRIFERFYRIDKGRLDKGTGLGLAIVKHITHKYHGVIGLESSLQNGTEITIKFHL